MNPENYKKMLTWLYGYRGPIESIWEDIYIEKIEAAMDTLDARTARVLRRRLEGQTLKQIGISEGVTRERIRQIEAKGLRQLRHPQRLDLNTHIKSVYLCEMEKTGEVQTGSFEHRGEMHTYEYERRRCQVCGRYDDKDAPDYRCAGKIPRAT